MLNTRANRSLKVLRLELAMNRLLHHMLILFEQLRHVTLVSGLLGIGQAMVEFSQSFPMSL
jgi:hypothetical protein